MVLDGACARGCPGTGSRSSTRRGRSSIPTEHEALSTVAVEGTESGNVVEVLQKGYRLDEQLVRPARVVVSE